MSLKSLRRRLLRLPRSVMFRARRMLRTAMSRMGATVRHRVYGVSFITDPLTDDVPLDGLRRAGRLGSETGDIVAYADTVQCRALVRYLKRIGERPVILDIGAPCQ